MKNKVYNVIISYWYKELLLNPISKVGELENSLKSIFINPFLVNNNLELGTNISIPRIQAMTEDKTMLFTMSLVNANLSIHIKDDMDYDEVVLLVNENIQLFYDVLKEIYNVEIIYSSIKVELSKEDTDACNYLANKLGLINNEYEDLSFKKVIRKDDYYISYFINTGKEINFNIELKNNVRPSQNDMLDRSMLISLKNANINKYLLTTVIEINDRLAYNLDDEYMTTKESIRGMIGELKSVLNKDIDDIIEKK